MDTIVSFDLGLAQVQDAAALVAIHYAAVHQTAAPFYAPAVLHSWAPPLTPTRVVRFASMIADPRSVWYVAKRETQVLGFGVLLPASQRLKGLYVHPDAGRQGVGTLLLHALEDQAAQRGVTRLQLDASLNAVSFYHRQGYGGSQTRWLVLPTGCYMCCQSLSKSLTGLTSDRASVQVMVATPGLGL